MKKTMAILFSLAFLAGSLYAQQCGFGMGGKQQCGRNCLQEILGLPGLNGTQKDKAFKAFSDHQDKMYALRKDVRQAKWDIKKLWKAKTLNKKAIKAQQDKIAAAKDKMLRERQAFRLGITGLLTLKQRQAYFSPCPGMQCCPAHASGKHMCPKMMKMKKMKMKRKK
jgi:Spy/CpxP family protein refolding chaperone